MRRTSHWYFGMKSNIYTISEGLLVTCSYDYLSQDWNRKTFMLYAFFGNYLIPMITMIFFYVHIVKAVVMHEAALKAQAKKMNVESLRSNVSCCQLFVYFLSQLFVYILSFRTKEGRVQK